MTNDITLHANKGPSPITPVGKGGKIVIASDSPPPGDATNGTSINLFDDIGSTLCHISFRPQPPEGVIVINSKPYGQEWGQETRINLGAHVLTYKHVKFTIRDNSDSYEVSFADGGSATHDKIKGLVNVEATKISYDAPKGQSFLDNPIKVTVVTGD